MSDCKLIRLNDDALFAHLQILFHSSISYYILNLGMFFSWITRSMLGIQWAKVLSCVLTA